MKKNIAIICYDMIPYSTGWGASQRVYYYASLLSKQHNVYVISAKRNNSENFYNHEITFHQKFYPVSSKVQNSNSLNSQKTNFLSKIRKFLGKLLREFDSLINNDPNKGLGIHSMKWILIHKKEILNYIKENKINDIIISVPPFGLLLPSFFKEVKNVIKGRIIIDYRDPWNCWNERKGISFLREKAILSLCDHIIVTNENHQYKIISDFNIDKSKIITVSNGFDNDLWLSIKEKTTNCDKLVISFIGYIALNKKGYRDISVFLKALDQCPFKNSIILRIVGVNGDSDRINKTYNVNIPFIELIPTVSQVESFKYMVESDILLSLHTATDCSSTYLIAGKIFDYYRSGTKILSINSEKSLEHKFIRNNNIGYCTQNNESDIIKTLSDIYNCWCENEKVMSKNNSLSIEYSRNRQNEKILNLINTI